MDKKKSVAIVQSCYIPWKGYFDLMNQVDEFILYDDVQFTRRDWRNRNMIKTPSGIQWLTIPVIVKGQYNENINTIKVADKKWLKKHWKSITLNYAKTPFFYEYKKTIESLYQSLESDYLSQINFKFLKEIANILGIKTKISWSTDYKIDNHLKKTERLVALCQAASATHYLSGPSAKDYIDKDLFKQKTITLEYINYSGYKKYPQLFGDFVHTVTILDVIFNTGHQSLSFINTKTDSSCLIS